MEADPVDDPNIQVVPVINPIAGIPLIDNSPFEGDQTIGD